MIKNYSMPLANKQAQRTFMPNSIKKAENAVSFKGNDDNSRVNNNDPQGRSSFWGPLAGMLGGSGLGIGLAAGGALSAPPVAAAAAIGLPIAGMITGHIAEQKLTGNQPSSTARTPAPEQISSEPFANVAGMEAVKDLLNQEVLLPMSRPDLAEKFGTKPVNGVLLYGAPGTGKTHIAIELAKALNRPVFEISSDTVGSKMSHETPRKIMQLARQAEKKQGVLFINELDGLGGNHEVIGEQTREEETALLNAIEGLNESGAIVIATVNDPKVLPQRLTRTGRFDVKVPVGPPDQEGRKAILKQYLAKSDAGKALAENDDALEQIAGRTRGLVASDLKNIAESAGRRLVSQNIKMPGIADTKITPELVDVIVDRIPPENFLTEKDCKKYGYDTDKFIF